MFSKVAPAWLAILSAIFLLQENLVTSSPTPRPFDALANSTNTTTSLGQPLRYFGNLDISIFPRRGVESIPLSTFTHVWLCYVGYVWQESIIPESSGSYCDPHTPSIQIRWDALPTRDMWGGFWPVNIGEAGLVYLQQILRQAVPNERNAVMDQFDVSFTGEREGHFDMWKVRPHGGGDDQGGGSGGYVPPSMDVGTHFPHVGNSTSSATSIQPFKRDLTGCGSSRLAERLKLLVNNLDRSRQLSQAHFFGAIADTLRRYVLVKKATDKIPPDYLGQKDRNNYIYARYRSVIMRIYIENVDQGISRATWMDLEEVLRQLVLLPQIVDGPYAFEATAHAIGKGGGLGSVFVRITVDENALSGAGNLTVGAQEDPDGGVVGLMGIGGLNSTSVQ